jgi:hypothetical protein
MSICLYCKGRHSNIELCYYINNSIIYFKNLNINEILDEIKCYKNNNKNFKCNICRKYFTNNKNLRNHINKKVCEKDKGHKCKICNKFFAIKRNYKYHVNNKVCFKTNQNNIQNIQNIQNNITNIQTQNNIQNNNQQIIIAVNNADDFKKVVELIPFRNIKYNITTETYLEYVNNPDQAIKKFIKDQHFNPNKPERMNVHNTNLKSNRIHVFDDEDNDRGRWMIKDKSTITELLYDRGLNHLFVAKDIVESNGIRIDPRKIQKLEEKIKQLENDDKTRKEYMEMISDMSYNYREMVEENKKSIYSIQTQNLVIL